MILEPSSDGRSDERITLTAPLLACIDEPAQPRVIAPGGLCTFSGWTFSVRGPVRVKARYGERSLELGPDVTRPDVLAALSAKYPTLTDLCGFRFRIDVARLPEPIAVVLEFTDGEDVIRSAPFEVDTSGSSARDDYKRLWNALSADLDDAKIAVAGYTDEAEFLRAGEATLATLRDTVGIRPDDVVLDIGAGVGRAGAVLAPLCKRWIGTDVSENMLKHAAARLAHYDNVEFLAINGWDLEPIESSSIDVAYSTVVFMHLDEWERYGYVREALRVLRPGGRLYVDNINLLGEDGWALFVNHARDYRPLQRPPHISKCSTPQELYAYFTRVGFTAVRQRTTGLWLSTWGIKPIG
jgi:SAM-dependent methyltransferase